MAKMRTALIQCLGIALCFGRTTAFQAHVPQLLRPTIEKIAPGGHVRHKSTSVELYLFRRLFGGRKGNKSGTITNDEPHFQVVDHPDISPQSQRDWWLRGPTEVVDVCIIGGGVSGLAAAITAGNALKGKDKKIVLLEADEYMFGGRVQSDETSDGYVLDRGFAVWIEQYPFAKKLVDYDKLELGAFLPGALVKVKGRNRLARVADPLRQPEELLNAALAPVGSIIDKYNILPIIFNCRSKSIEELFEEPETNTEEALRSRWEMGDKIMDRFFRPFLEGIFLATIEEQSSRMFSFIFKMFSEGAATLPAGGIGMVGRQLTSKAAAAGADMRLGQVVTKIRRNDDGFIVRTLDGSTRVQSKAVVVATDGDIAHRLLAGIDGFESLSDLPKVEQRAVGCLYYGFKGEAPVQDPILILSGMGDDRGSQEFPINNVCFPSVVAKRYAPAGCSLCSVTILKTAMEAYRGRESDLDAAVRRQLATWFPEVKTDVMNKWELKAIYDIENAQPAQFGGPHPANINGGREPDMYWNKQLPNGLFVCGDHMATATINGALESGVNAGSAAAKAAQSTLSGATGSPNAVVKGEELAAAV